MTGTLMHQSALFNLVPFGTSLLISILMIPLIRKFSLTYHLYNDAHTHTERYGNLVRQDGLSSIPTPHYGGIGVVFAFFISTFLWLSPQAYSSIFLCSIAIFILGITDDIHPLPARFRLLLQCLLAWTVAHSLNISLQEISLTQHMTISIPKEIGHLLAIVIIVGGINTINMIDGMDGLAGGIALIGFTSLSILHSISSGSPDSILLLAVPFAGAILGFLSYNTYPASIFMGDSGSNWLGFMLGVLLLMILSQGSAEGLPPVSFISALCCLGVPVIDTAVVIFLRIRSGQSPFHADNRHFHHTLLGLGFNTRQSVTVIYLISVVLAACGILPSLYPQLELDWLPWTLFLTTTVLIASAPLKRKYAKDFKITETEPSESYLKFLFATESITLYGVYALLILSTTIPRIANSSSLFSLIPMATLLIGTILVREQRKTDFLSCFLIALAGMTLVATSQADAKLLWPAPLPWVNVYQWVLGLVTITTSLTVLSSIPRCLKALTPTDLLVFLMFLTILGVTATRDPHLGFMGCCGLILFMGTRTLVTIPGAIFRVRIVTFLCLIIASAKMIQNGLPLY